jgi:N-acetylmuramic acid 6-phosphate etherase
MVDVQTTNLKLQRRAITIVQQATGLDTVGAEALLGASGGEVKTAILVGCGHVEPQVAREVLAKHGNVLRAALEALQ